MLILTRGLCYNKEHKKGRGTKGLPKEDWKKRLLILENIAVLLLYLQVLADRQESGVIILVMVIYFGAEFLSYITL